MSRRRNSTNHAGSMLGLSMYNPMNTGKRKRPKGVAAPIEALTKSINNRISGNGGKING